MAPVFQNPWWLLLAPVFIYLLWIIQRNTYAEATPQRLRFWFLFRSIIILLLLAALAGLQFRTEVQQKQVLFLMDASASISPEQSKQAAAWINEAMRKIEPPDQAGIIVFGGDAAVERFPASSRLFEKPESRINTTATNFDEALQLAEAVFAAGFQKNIVLLTDGNENSGDAQKRLADLKKNGVSMQALYLKPENRPEAAVENLRLPDQVGLKQNFFLDAVLSSNRNSPSLIQVFKNGALIQEGTLQLKEAGKEMIRLPQRIEEPGIYRYEIRLKPQDDFLQENNTREVWISVEGPPRVLLVDEEPSDLQPLKTALNNRGFQTDLKSVSGFPSSIAEMLQYQGIMIRNISATQIHSQLEMIRSYVRDFGGGFAMLGGKSSFGPGGYYQTPVEETLPVRMDLVNKKYLADVAMVIVIDKSGSMSYTDRGRQKIDLADEGGARVASLLKNTDQLGVIAVDSVPKWAFQIQKLARKQNAIDSITSIRAGGGGIYVYSGLREAYDALSRVDATVKHVILFADTADCEEKDGPSGESSLQMAQRYLRDQKITTTSIGIGQAGDVDVEFLDQLALAGQGRFYFTNDMFTLPEIFTQESAIVQRNYINEEQFSPLIGQREPVLSGIDAVPDLLGYVATSAKSGATIGMASPKEDPVLASWRFGMGQSLAFTSDPTAAWGRLWLEWNEYERFWAQAARFIARPPATPHFQTTFSSAGSNTMIVVEALDDAGAFINDALFQGVLVDSDGRQHSVTLSQNAPGRYEAIVPASGSLFGKIYRHDSNQIVEEAVVQYAGPENRELVSDFSGRSKLEHYAGPVLDSATALRYPEKSTDEIQPLRSQLLWLAAILFLFDVAFRKISFRDIKLPEMKTVQTPATSPALSQLKGIKKPKVQEQAPIEAILLETELEHKDLPVPPQVQPRIESSDYLERLKKAKRRN